jgi:hypothetical protein
MGYLGELHLLRPGVTTFFAIFPLCLPMTRFILYCFIFFSVTLSAQEGYLEFAGRCVKDNQPLKGATITVYKGATKVSELISPKNGKFQFFLPFGADYKITFTNPGCPDMYLMVSATKFPEDPEVEPIYDIDVNFFEYGKPTINYANFKNPFTKVIYDGKKRFKDDDAYAADFLANLYIDPEEIRKRDEAIVMEKQKKELEAKMKREADEKLRQQQLVDAQRKAQEEADQLKKQLEEKARREKQNEPKNAVNEKENESQESMVSEEVQLTIDKEKRNIKEKQNRAVKAAYENDLLKIVATNERKSKEAEFVKKKETATSSEIIETLKREAETKAMSEQVLFDSKLRNKQAVFNRGIKNEEMLTLIKQSAFNSRDMRIHGVKKFPEAASYKARGLAGVSTDVEQSSFKTIYTVTVSVGNTKTVFRKEKFSWGVTYYYKNEKEITESEYVKEVSPYNIPL